MYNPVIRHLYYLWSDHSNKCSTHLAPYIVITILLTIFPMLYFISPQLFCIFQFGLLISFTFFTQALNPLPFGNRQTVLCIYEFISVLFCSLDFAYKWNCGVCLSLSDLYHLAQYHLVTRGVQPFGVSGPHWKKKRVVLGHTLNTL